MLKKFLLFFQFITFVKPVRKIFERKQATADTKKRFMKHPV